MGVSGRKCGETYFEDGVTNGADWYNVPGNQGYITSDVINDVIMYLQVVCKTLII